MLPILHLLPSLLLASFHLVPILLPFSLLPFSLSQSAACGRPLLAVGRKRSTTTSSWPHAVGRHQQPVHKLELELAYKLEPAHELAMAHKLDPAHELDPAYKHELKSAHEHEHKLVLERESRSCRRHAA